MTTLMMTTAVTTKTHLSEWWLPCAAARQKLKGLTPSFKRSVFFLQSFSILLSIKDFFWNNWNNSSVISWVSTDNSHQVLWSTLPIKRLDQKKQKAYFYFINQLYEMHPGWDASFKHFEIIFWLLFIHDLIQRLFKKKI